MPCHRLQRPWSLIALLWAIDIAPHSNGKSSLDYGGSQIHYVPSTLQPTCLGSSESGKAGLTCKTDPFNSRLFSDSQHEAFEREGFLVVSGMLEGQMGEFVAAGDAFVANSAKMKAYFSNLELGMIFQAGKADNRTITDAFRRIALDSLIPQAVAELMRLPPDQRVRVLRDVFMSKSVHEDATCDWHVDDVGFWPESYISEREGINVWIAMEDMPARYQGSMALSPGSHHADWRFKGYEAIGQNRTFHGGFTKEEAKERAASGERLLTTCEMNQNAPELRATIEKTIYIPNIKKGDIIFAKRTLFHRTLPVTEEGKRYYAERGIEYLNRYSVRYVPGTARLPSGWTFEWSIVNNDSNEGRSLDQAMDNDDSLWYPQVWPCVDENVDDRLDTIAETELEGAKTKTRAELFELFSLFSPN